MKTLTMITLLLALGSRGLAASVETPAPVIPPAAPSVNVPTTVSELAAGYAAAVRQMSLKSLVIFIRSDGKTIAVRGIRSAQGLNGVLLITFSAGDMMAINAESIVMITDGARTP